MRGFAIHAAMVLGAGLCVAQQQPATAAFKAQTDLVTVLFQVRRGSHPVDLKASDVVLLEDGAPRGFTIFEQPPEHLTLDLVVMFDVTNSVAGEKRTSGFWDTKALGELAGYWNESNARRLLDERGATIRYSIYRFDQRKLARLCQFSSDPKVLSDALQRLARPSGEDTDIPLLPGLAIRARERKAVANHKAPEQWSLAGALSVLQDSGGNAGADKATSARALVIFSTGAEGTSVTPDDLADRAVSAGVPVYPVALVPFPVPVILAYDGYRYDNLFNYGVEDGARSMWGPNGPYVPMFGPADRPNLPSNAPPVAPYINYPFEILGELTGGLHFEAVNHSRPLGDSGVRYVADRNTGMAFSMNGAETENVLDRVKRHAMARFHTSYTIGFVPSHTGSPREHTLEVKLAAKGGGKLTEGKRSAIY